jgi:hypothetical protein
VRASFCFAAIALSLSGASSDSKQSIRVLLPERTRLLEHQRIDLVLEVRGTANPQNLRVMAGKLDLTSKFKGPVPAKLDCDRTPGVVSDGQHQ